MNTREIITKTAAVVNCTNPEKFWEDIKKQNKEKKWSVSPVKIEFKNGQIVENSEQIKQLVNLMKKWAENELKATDINILEKDTEIVKVIFEWFSGSRKQITKKFDEIKKNFIAVEADIKNIGLSFKQRKEELLEEEYKSRELALIGEIKLQLDLIKDEYNIGLDINLFSDFVAAKRKTKILTEKGKLTKKIKDEIKSKINEVLEPILKEREAQKLKEQDLQKLALDLQDINVGSLFIEELEHAYNQLVALLNTVDIRYPNAIKEAEAQLNANIKLVKANIARLKAEEEKEVLKKIEEERIAEEKAKEEEIRKRAEVIQEAQKGVTNAKNNKYKIPLEEIEVIAAIEIEAASEEEAKEKALNIFKQQLQLINLIKI